MQNRKIIHVDMDAFFASVEQRDNPDLAGRPVAVGGNPNGRGVVAAASYEARKFGVRSAMPASEAARLCKNLIFVKPRIAVYKRVSNQIFGLLRAYTDLVEPLSLDEAYMDVTRNKKGICYASSIAKEVREIIKSHTGLSASCGVSNSKFLAKIASDLNKPDGMAVIPPSAVDDFLKTLPIRKVPGIGPKTEEKLLSLGLRTVGSFRDFQLSELQKFLGSRAEYFQKISVGIDEREVRPKRTSKSIGAERTFQKDTNDKEFLLRTLTGYSERIEKTLKGKGVLAKTVTLKARYKGFETITRSKTLSKNFSDKDTIYSIGTSLLELTEYKCKELRLLGLSVSNLEKKEEEDQLTLNF